VIRVATHFRHFVDLTGPSEAPVLACADAVASLARQGMPQEVVAVSFDRASALRRARLLGLEPAWVLHPRHHRFPARLATPRRLVNVAWGASHAVNLVALSPVDAGDYLVVDLLRGEMEWLGGGLFGTREPLPPEAGLTVDDTWTDAPRRAAIRESLGLDPDDLLMLTLDDPSTAVDAHAAAEIAGMLRAAGIALTLLVPRSAMHVDRAVRHAREGHAGRLLLTEDPVASLAAAADLGVLLGPPDRRPYSSLVAVRHAHRCGTRIVVAAAGAGGVATDGVGIWLAKDASTASLASACMRAAHSPPPPGPRDDDAPTIGEAVAARVMGPLAATS
jgi:hypothetical protein